MWPVEGGRYWVGNPEAPVAICTLADLELMERLKSLGEKVAICGKCVTENLGIEKVVRNIVTNPHIEYLVLCGEESRGHFVGQAIKSLKENGVDEKRRIVGAVGPIPYLRNLKDEEIEEFRRRVEIVDLIGERDVDRIREVVEALRPKGRGRRVEAEGVEVVEAREDGLVKMDPKGYFLISVKDGKIVVEHYSWENRLLRKIVGRSGRAIYKEIIRNGWVSELTHAAYLGYELALAELALKNKGVYEQEKEVKVCTGP